MLNSEFKEKLESRVEIKAPGIKPEIFKNMLNWMYQGECELPSDVLDLIQLLNLSDEYILHDL